MKCFFLKTLHFFVKLCYNNLVTQIDTKKRGDKVKQGFKNMFKDTQQREVKHYTKKRAAGILAVFSALLCVLSVLGFLWVRASFTDVDLIKAWVDENYLLGSILMFFICAIQVVIAFIPGELLEIASGYAFGSIMGSVICTAGIMFGSVIAILLARRFGRSLVESIYPREKIDALPIINDPKKRNATVFLLFLIPGTPKDMLTYVVGLTNMSIPKYIALTMFARFPSVIMSTFGGDALGENKFMLALVAFVVTAIISGSGYLVYLFINSKSRQKSDEKNADRHE